MCRYKLPKNQPKPSLLTPNPFFVSLLFLFPKAVKNLLYILLLSPLLFIFSCEDEEQQNQIENVAYLIYNGVNYSLNGENIFGWTQIDGLPGIRIEYGGFSPECIGFDFEASSSESDCAGGNVVIIQMQSQSSIFTESSGYYSLSTTGLISSPQTEIGFAINCSSGCNEAQFGGNSSDPELNWTGGIEFNIDTENNIELQANGTINDTDFSIYFNGIPDSVLEF